MLSNSQPVLMEFRESSLDVSSDCCSCCQACFKDACIGFLAAVIHAPYQAYSWSLHSIQVLELEPTRLRVECGSIADDPACARSGFKATSAARIPCKCCACMVAMQLWRPP